jgi:tetratricopeptide (TPR) repeat protein
MTKLRLLTLAAAVAVGFAASAYGAAYLAASSRGGAAGTDVSAATVATSDYPDAETQIAFWSARVDDQPEAYLDLTLLGQALSRKARETSDVEYYVSAEAALERARRVNPSYVPASASLAAVRFSLHDFEGALALARPIVGDPRGVQALATLGDAELAIGKYRAARDAYARLSAWGSTPGVFSRLALFAELHGNHEQALRLMERAATMDEDAGDYGESLAWYSFQLGELDFRAGRFDAAQAHYHAALAIFPRYPLALAGLGKTRAALGDRTSAIALYRRATAIVPQPDFLAALGDLYAAEGRRALAREQYATVELIGRLARINRQVYNRQLALFHADHAVHLAAARRLALRELRVRKDVYGYDAVGWTLARSGRCHEALVLAAQALQLGTKDALLYFHRGYAEGCAGNRVGMRAWYRRALDLNPAFSIHWAPIARAAVRGGAASG